jgi:hypothetical protein
MTPEQLLELRNSSAAPFDHMDYTIWLHDKIVEELRYKIWEVREKGGAIEKNGYQVCNSILNLPALRKCGGK